MMWEWLSKQDQIIHTLTIKQQVKYSWKSSACWACSNTSIQDAFDSHTFFFALKAERGQWGSRPTSYKNTAKPTHVPLLTSLWGHQHITNVITIQSILMIHEAKIIHGGRSEVMWKGERCESEQQSLGPNAFPARRLVTCHASRTCVAVWKRAAWLFCELYFFDLIWNLQRGHEEDVIVRLKRPQAKLQHSF